MPDCSLNQIPSPEPSPSLMQSLIRKARPLKTANFHGERMDFGKNGSFFDLTDLVNIPCKKEGIRYNYYNRFHKSLTYSSKKYIEYGTVHYANGGKQYKKVVYEQDLEDFFKDLNNFIANHCKVQSYTTLKDFEKVYYEPEEEPLQLKHYSKGAWDVSMIIADFKNKRHDSIKHLKEIYDINSNCLYVIRVIVDNKDKYDIPFSLKEIKDFIKIGRSGCIWERLEQHLKSSLNKKHCRIEKIAIYEINSCLNKVSIEKDVLEKFKGNKDIFAISKIDEPKNSIECFTTDLDYDTLTHSIRDYLCTLVKPLCDEIYHGMADKLKMEAKTEVKEEKTEVKEEDVHNEKEKDNKNYLRNRIINTESEEVRKELYEVYKHFYGSK